MLESYKDKVMTYGEWMTVLEENNLEIKQKQKEYVPRRYPICEMKIKGRVLYEGVPHSYINNDVNGYEIITDMGNEKVGYFFTIWSSHCVPITDNRKEVKSDGE